MSISLLVVDDDSGNRLNLRGYLRARDFEVAETDTYAKALAMVQKGAPTAVLLADDLWNSNGDAIRCFNEIRSIAPTTVIIFCGDGSIERTVRGMHAGAHGYVSRGSSPAVVHDLVLKHAPRRPTAPTLKAAASANFFEFGSLPMRRLEEQTARVLEATASVLIVGGAGVGKKRLARHIHERGPRAQMPFVEVCCAGLSLELFEGAGDSTRGLLELANGGTLVLDDIESLDKTVQRALLSAIEHTNRKYDVRIISTAKTDLAGESPVQRDLFYRLATITLRVPSLRERKDDIVPISRRLVTSLCAISRRELPVIESDVERMLLQHHWNGGVRELKDVLQRSLDRATSAKITKADVVLGEKMTTVPRSRYRVEVAR